jgi:hypothetical protein
MQDSKASVRSGWKRWLPTSAEKDSPACGLPPDADSPPEYWQAILSDARADAAGQSISRRQTPPGSTVRTRSGKMSVSGCSTTPARSEPGVLRKTAAGRPSTYLRRQSMAPKYDPTPLSGGDRKALTKEFRKARAMANILSAQPAEMRAKAELCCSRPTGCWAKAGTRMCFKRPTFAYHGAIAPA